MRGKYLLSKTEALSICHSLSRPSKVPGHAYSLPAEQCRLGSVLRFFPRAVCSHCYALRGRYVFRVVRKAMQKRLESLAHPRWVEAITALIARSGDAHFRWHDSGDIQNLQHLRNIVAVCKNLPQVKFWLPTREYQTVQAWRRLRGRIPPNLCIRYSAHIVDGRPPLHYGLPVSVVRTDLANAPGGAHLCPAKEQGNKCCSCRACWNPLVRIVIFPLK